MTVMRSKLFVPASRPALFDKAMSGPADAISFDLEDAVAADRKDSARQDLVAFLAALAPDHRGKTVVVRINAPGTAFHEADLEAIAAVRPDVINLPMVEDPEVVRGVASRLDRLEGTVAAAGGAARRIALLANIESPLGLRRAGDIAAAHPRVIGLQIGYADLLSPLGIAADEPAAIQYVRAAVRFAAAEAGKQAWDGAYVDIRNPEGYRRECEAARRLGFAGKSCIHPSQVDTANLVFQPGEAELAHARRVVQASRTAAREGVGAFVVDGQMVDGPFIERAEALIAWAERLGLATGES